MTAARAVLATLLFAVLLVLAGCQPSPGVKEDPRSGGRTMPAVDRVRELAGAMNVFDTLALVRYGAAAFPAYEVILSDPGSHPREVAGVLSALIQNRGPKGQFLPLAAPFLAHRDESVRSLAAILVGQIGTPAEGAALVALLSDKDTVIAHQAAQALTKVGGPGEVIAMDAWLRTGTAHRADKVLQDRVLRCRDELDARLRGVALAPPPREKK